MVWGWRLKASLNKLSGRMCAKSTQRTSMQTPRTHTHTHSNHIKLMLNKEGGIYTEPRQIPKALTNYQKKKTLRGRGAGVRQDEIYIDWPSFFSSCRKPTNNRIRPIATNGRSPHALLRYTRTSFDRPFVRPSTLVARLSVRPSIVLSFRPFA